MAAVWFALGPLVLDLSLLWFLILPSPGLDLYFGRFWSNTYIWLLFGLLWLCVGSCLVCLGFGLNLLWFLIWPSPRLDLYFGRFWSKPRSSPAAPGANHKDIRYRVIPYLQAVGICFLLCEI